MDDESARDGTAKGNGAIRPSSQEMMDSGDDQADLMADFEERLLSASGINEEPRDRNDGNAHDREASQENGCLTVPDFDECRLGRATFHYSSKYAGESLQSSETTPAGANQNIEQEPVVKVSDLLTGE